jgi:multiple sugar transport system substrate-binding protein
MRSKKRLILLSAITVVLLLSINIAASAKTKVSLLMVDLEGPVRPIVLEELIPEFERLNPDIEVEVELASWAGYTEKLQTLFVSGLIPDVFQCGATGTILADYATRGLLLPLENEIEDWEDWPEAAIEDVTFEGHMYGVPYRLDLRPFWWRKDHFEEAGLGREAKPRTWDEMIEVAQKLTIRRSDGQFERAGVDQGGDYPGWWWYSLYQAGGRLFNDDFTQSEVNSSAGIDAMQFYVDISNKYELCPPTGMPSVGADPVVSGRASMQYGPDALLLQMKDQFPEELEHLGVGAPLQRYEDTEPATSVFINKYAVHKGTKDKEASLRLVKWL